MGYMHIDNLYKNQTVLQFKDVYVLEKVHGTSAHVNLARLEGGLAQSTYHAGGADSDAFCRLFDTGGLHARFMALGHERLTVYGETYGGKLHRGSHQYGPELRFVAFDVKHHTAGGDRWMDVPAAQAVVHALGLEFVPWDVCRAEVEVLNGYRDAPSRLRHLEGQGAWSEGIVIRPIQEWTDWRGNRVIAKHKRPEMRETKTPREVVPGAFEVEADAQRIAVEWVTPVRMDHVLDHLRSEGVDVSSIAATGRVIAAMTEDVLREGAGEIVDSRPARRAIGALAGRMFRAGVEAVG